MKIIQVIDEFGRSVCVDESQRQLYDYNNAKKEIVYNAPIVEDGVVTFSHTNYTVRGTVDDIEERLKKWNNLLRLVYAEKVGYNAPVNDPDGAIWKSFVEYIRKNEDRFFTKQGDFKRRHAISTEQISEIVNSI